MNKNLMWLLALAGLWLMMRQKNGVAGVMTGAAKTALDAAVAELMKLKAEVEQLKTQVGGYHGPTEYTKIP